MVVKDVITLFFYILFLWILRNEHSFSYIFSIFAFVLHVHSSCSLFISFFLTRSLKFSFLRFVSVWRWASAVEGWGNDTPLLRDALNIAPWFLIPVVLTPPHTHTQASFLECSTNVLSFMQAAVIHVLLQACTLHLHKPNGSVYYI